MAPLLALHEWGAPKYASSIVQMIGKGILGSVQVGSCFGSKFCPASHRMPSWLVTIRSNMRHRPLIGQRLQARRSESRHSLGLGRLRQGFHLLP